MDDEQIDDNTINNAINAYMEREEKTIDSVLHTLYGKLPDWIPSPSVERARRTIQGLIGNGFSAVSICQRVKKAEKDKLTFPGIVTDPAAYAQAIYELAHIRYALSLGELGGLDILAGKQAAKGARFKPKRALGSKSLKTKYIEQLANKHQGLSAKELLMKADREIIGDMTTGTFQNRVSKVRAKKAKP